MKKILFIPFMITAIKLEIINDMPRLKQIGKNKSGIIINSIRKEYLESIGGVKHQVKKNIENIDFNLNPYNWESQEFIVIKYNLKPISIADNRYIDYHQAAKWYLISKKKENLSIKIKLSDLMFSKDQKVLLNENYYLEKYKPVII